MAVILCAHGAEGSSATAEHHAHAIRERALFADVRACCLKGSPSLDEAMASIGSRPVHIVPVLMSRGHTWATVLPRALCQCQHESPRVTIGQPMGLDPAVGEIIARRARVTCEAREWRPGETRVLLVAHGRERDTDAREAAVEHARRVDADRIFAGVTPAFLNDRPRVEEALSALVEEPCVVVGLFADHGPHGAVDVEDVIRRSGRRVAYAGPIGDDGGFTDIIIRHALSVTRWKTAA